MEVLWKSYETWLRERNKKRSELETKFGYDCKHASHLVRLLRMGDEILSTGKVNVDRTNIDAAELVAIKNDGIWSYDFLMEWAEGMDKKLTSLYEENPMALPKKPRIKAIEKAYFETVELFYNS